MAQTDTNQGEFHIMDNAEKNIYVKKQITAALLELLETKELKDISVSQITATAKVSRISFYRNYQDKEDILRVYMKQLMADFRYEHRAKDDQSEQNWETKFILSFEGAYHRNLRTETRSPEPCRLYCRFYFLWSVWMD